MKTPGDYAKDARLISNGYCDWTKHGGLRANDGRYRTECQQCCDEDAHKTADLFAEAMSAAEAKGRREGLEEAARVVGMNATRNGIAAGIRALLDDAAKAKPACVHEWSQGKEDGSSACILCGLTIRPATETR